MSRILLADDSPHAQRMGERILREEGFEVVTVTDGATALVRLPDVDPDLILADVFLPLKSGYDICAFVKSQPRWQHVRVVLTAGALEPLDEAAAQRAGADGTLRKPFEASVVVGIIKPLLDAARYARGLFAAQARAQAAAEAEPAPAEPVSGEDVSVEAMATAEPSPVSAPISSPQSAQPAIDPERVRAAVTLALDASLPAMIEEITERVLVALGH